MDEREQQRKIRHRLAVLRHAEEVSGKLGLLSITLTSSSSAVQQDPHAGEPLNWTTALRLRLGTAQMSERERRGCAGTSRRPFAGRWVPPLLGTFG